MQAFRKLKEDATDLNNRFPFTEQQLINLGKELGLVVQKLSCSSRFEKIS